MGWLDDLLREAADPATTGERLQEIRRAYYLQPGVLEAVDGNPSTSLPTIAVGMRAGKPAAWYNPSAALVLLAEPDERWREWARLMLLKVGDIFHNDHTLESLVRAWSDMRVEAFGRPHWTEAKALARRLAELFGLPWPKQAAAE